MDPTPATDPAAVEAFLNLTLGQLLGGGGVLGGGGLFLGLVAQWFRANYLSKPTEPTPEAAPAPALPDGYSEHIRKADDVHAAIVGTVDSRPLFDRLDGLRSDQGAHTISLASLAASVNRLADQVGDLAKAQRGPE